MQTQWYLCEISKYPDHEGENLQTNSNLSIKHADIFEGGWCVWLPIIPRVGDILQFPGWQVQVSRVVLMTDHHSKAGLKEGLEVSASISIRDNVIPYMYDSHYAIEALNNKDPNKWENYARRGHDLQYYAWELKHERYLQEQSNSFLSNEIEKYYYRWHTRIRPVAGDLITVNNDRWRVRSVELASADASIDGWLMIEEIA